jgi:hypothetical protein
LLLISDILIPDIHPQKLHYGSCMHQLIAEVVLFNFKKMITDSDSAAEPGMKDLHSGHWLG